MLLDVSIVNVALPSIEREFGVSAETVQWVVSGYALTFGLALVPAGPLGDTLGRRRMFLIALSAFVFTSALTGGAQTTGWLLAARLLQGVAGGMLVPQNVGLIQDMFRGGERARAFGVLGGVVGLSTATGPVVGGLILNLAGSPDGWRWVFCVNVPIGRVALVLAARLVPAKSTAVPAVHTSTWWDRCCSVRAYSGLLLPVVSNESGGAGWLWWLFVPATLLLTAFARWEVRTAGRGRPRCSIHSWRRPPASPPARPSHWSLHRVHRHLGRVGAVRLGRPWVFAAALRSGRDALRAGQRRVRGVRPAVRCPGGHQLPAGLFVHQAQKS